MGRIFVLVSLFSFGFEMEEFGSHSNVEIGNNFGIIAAIQDMANAIQNNHGGAPPENAEDRVLRIQGEFRKSKPPVFKGSTDPMIAEEWVRQMKRSLTNKRIPEDLQVTVACTYLEGQAYRWWESVLCIPNTVIATWAEFERVFLEKYFPSTQRRLKSREFSTLQQMNMPVGDYQAKFEELMRFAPELIPDDNAKARRFEEGLRPQIKEKVMMLKLDRYTDVVERALMAEQMMRESKAVFEASRVGAGPSNKRQRPNISQYQSNNRYPRPPLKCYRCGQEGHLARGCQWSQTYQAHQAPQPSYRAPITQYPTARPQSYTPPQPYRAPVPAQQNWVRPQIQQPAPRPADQSTAARPQARAKRQGHPAQGQVYAVGYGEEEFEGNKAEAVEQFQGEEEVEMGSLNNMEDPYDHTIVEGTLPIFNTWGKTLFDPGATHSFISTSFAFSLGLGYESLPRPLVIGSPIGRSMRVSKVSRSCMVEISGRRLFFDLMIMDLLQYDVSLGIDWLSHY